MYLFRRLVVAFVLTVAGYGCAEKQECVPEPPASVRARYHFLKDQPTPFPSDLFTVEDETTRTGRRLAVGPEGTPVIEEGLPILMEPEAFAQHLNQLDGFSVWAPLLFPVSGAIEAASLPATPEDSLLPQSSVFLVDISPASPTYRERAPVRVTMEEFDAENRFGYLLSIQPEKPLASSTRYAAVVTRDVLAEDGSPLGPTAEFSLVSGRCPAPSDHPDRSLIEVQREELRPLFEKPFSIDRDELAVAVAFTTQSFDNALASIHQVMQNEMPVAAVDFDADGDGQPDLYAPGELPNAPDGLTGLESVELVARGVFESPQLRNQDGVFQPGPDGAPQVVSTEEIPFILVLPADSGGQPYPVVILQHGNGGRKEYALYIAGHLAELGMAVVAIDLAEHGERPNTGHGFFDLANIPAVRCCFQQCAADMLRLVQVVEACARVDFSPGGTGDGVADLDVGKLVVVGESAGAQAAVMAAALEPNLEAAVINVGGGGYTSTLRHFLGGLYDERVIFKLGVLVQTIFDAGDPINYYRPYLTGETTGPGLPVLLQQVIGDSIMPNEATENLARVFGCPLVKPYAREVEGLEIVNSPATLHGLFQFDPAKHGFLLANDEHPDASRAARQQASVFFSTYFKDGQAVIENTWE